MVLININAAFVFLFCFVFFKGVILHFHASRVPFFLYLFYPTKHFCKTKNQLFLYFPFFFLVLVVNLIVSFSFIERLHSFVHLLLGHA